MNGKALLTALALAVAPAAAQQGFAGLDSAPEGFAPVTPGRAFAFPEDHAPHRAFRTEWWYVTANLEGPDGARYGAQWTLFRYGFAPGAPGEGWDKEEIWMAHAAVTAADAHHAADRYARGGMGQAGVEIGPFEAWIDDWRLAAAPDAEGLEAARMHAATEGFAFDLALEAEGPLVLQGEAGWSAKSADARETHRASYYYSQPFFRAEGTLTLDGAAIRVTGRAWMDREWSTEPLGPGQSGWDWFALHFDDGAKAMVARMREDGPEPFRAGTWIEPDGDAAPLDPADITLEPIGWAEVAGRETPVRWRLGVASRGVSVEMTPLNPKAWNALSVPYWEGPIAFSGSHEGVGYLEMTGY